MQNEAKILLVDDEPNILELLKFTLEKEGFTVKVANNGTEGIEIALTFKPDLIVLDLMMTGLNGFETCSKLREHKELDNSLIAFLTARSEDNSQITAFEAGADDYIHKPVKPQVFISRVRALLKRNNIKNETRGLSSQITIDRDRYCVKLDGEELTLPKKEFEILALLISNPDKVFTRDDILAKIWHQEIIVGDRTIDVHIRKLRERIGSEHIKTIKGNGYKFETNT